MKPTVNHQQRQQNQQPAEQQQSTPQLPESVQLTDENGQKVELPYSRALELAGQGLRINAESQSIASEREKLQQRQAALKEDEAGYSAYLQLQQLAKTNPNVAHAVRAAVANPESVMSALKAARGEGGDDDEDHGGDYDGGGLSAAQQPQLSTAQMQELGELRSTVKVLLDRENARANADATATVRQQVESELDAFPWLKDELRSEALRHSLMALAAEPQSNPTSVVANEASKIKELWEKRMGQAIDQQNTNRAFATVKPGAGGSGATEPPKLDKGSFKDGSMTKAVQGALSDLLRGVMPGQAS